jgi:hypothetical protein
MVNNKPLPKCEWCGAEKKVVTGLCEKCCRFPSVQFYKGERNE